MFVHTCGVCMRESVRAYVWCDMRERECVHAYVWCVYERESVRAYVWCDRVCSSIRVVCV